MWQPGIILGLVGKDEECVVYPHEPNRSYGFTKDYASYERYPNVTDAIMHAPARSLLIDDGIGYSYSACGDFWYHHEYSWRPVIMEWEQTIKLERSGHLRKCQPFCRLDEFNHSTGEKL
ncbi:MAG: hypothetical protein ACXAC5_02420 [Promethearchaeota archaeon]